MNDLLLFFGRFHTLAVHLPIGVLLLVVVAEIMTLRVNEARRARVDGALSLALPLLVLGAAGSIVLGLLLASDGGFPSRLVFWHRTLALVGGALVVGTYFVWRRRGTSRTAYRASLIVTTLMLTVAAHFGGSLTHGDSYLTQYAPWVKSAAAAKPPPPPPPPSADPLVFDAVVLPLLDKSCTQCHGEKKHSGGLRLDSLEAINKGGTDGPVITPGNGADSPLVSRMLLPVSDNDHMPPDDFKGHAPTKEEIAMLEWWIDRGATNTLKVKDAAPPAETRALLEAAASPKPAAKH